MSFLKMFARRQEESASESALRPALSVHEDFTAQSLRAVMRRMLLSRRRLVLRVRRLPQPLRPVHRLMLAGVDVVVVDSPQAARAIRACGVPAARIVLLSDPSDLGLFATGSRARASTAPQRLIHVGELEPETGVADLLASVTSWAGRHPDRQVEMWWVGEGCMRGVLNAQPVPANVTQRFLGEVSRPQMASLFLMCDMLVSPAVSDPWSHVIVEAMTAGLPVLGSNRLAAVGELVTDGETGWIFDPFEPGGLLRAVELALDTAPVSLDRMRAVAAARFRSAHGPVPGPGLEDRIRDALTLGTASARLDLKPLRITP